MSMKSAHFLGILLSALSADEHNSFTPKTNNQIVSKKPIKKVVPKGCNKYYFTKSGNMSIEGETYSDVNYVFDCIAMNEKSARKKFDKFINSKQQ